ncbi:ankyrin repeat-containing domain protein [Trichoderma austrokoningii]
MMDSIEGAEKKFEDVNASTERNPRSHEDQEMTGSKASLGSDDASWVVVPDHLEKSLASEPGGVSIRDETAVEVGQCIDAALAGDDFAFWTEDVKVQVKEQLIKNADGMPQYAIDQLGSLKRYTATKYILEALRELPQNIDAVYDKMLLSTDEKLRPQIISSLKWVAFSIDPLDIDLLSEIWAQAFSTDDILEFFCGLLINQDGGIQFDRPYMREYLTSDRIRISPVAAFSFTANDAQLHIAKSCLECHLQRNFSDNSSTSAIVEEQNEEDGSKLKAYATKNWCLHLDAVPRASWPPETFQAANLALNARSRSLYGMLNSVTDCPFVLSEAWLNPLIYTAHMNAYQLTEMLISEGLGTHEYITQSDLEAALLSAASAGSFEVVQLLREKGANVGVKKDDCPIALVEAAKNSHLEIVRFLVEERFATNIFSKALDDAAREGKFGVVEFLVLNETPVSKYALKTVAGSSGGSPESLECLQLLLDHSKGMKLEAALCKAAAGANWKAFEILLSRGANINGLDGRHGTPLHLVCAAQDLDESRVEYLLSLGANPKTRAGMHGTPLQTACYSYAGRDEQTAIRVAKLLMSHGAGINKTGGELGSALKNACGSKGKDGVSWYSLVEFLLQNGADVNVKGGSYDTALQVACHVGHADIVRLLLDWGAVVNPGDDGYVHAYVHAIIAASFTKPKEGYEGDIEMVQLLLDHGADINQTGSNMYGCALQAATMAENTKLVRFLLDHGAEVDLEFANSGTALKSACAQGHNEIARLLLDRGADVNAGGRNAGVIIQTACWCERSNDEMIHMLLDHGADIRLTGFTYVPLLHMAAISDGIRDNATLKRLLYLGADINEIDTNRGTPLHAVLRKLFEDNSIKPSRIQFLIEHGADVNLDVPTFGFGSPLHHLCANPVYDSSKYPPQKAAALLFQLCPQLDVNAQSGRYGSALQAAVFCDLDETVRVLLDNGADVNASGGRYNNALNAAVVRGFWNTARMLLDLGATPDCHGQDAPDEKWLASIAREDGKMGVERYKKFWEVESKKYAERDGKLNA